MSVELSLNGKTFQYPTENDLDWGYQASEWAREVTLSLDGGGGASGGLAGLRSIAQLRAHTKLNLQTAITVNSYWGDTDGGGGTYYVADEGDTTPDDGGYCIIADDGTRWLLENNGPLNVKQFGARGDGIQDDTQYIQKCFDTCGTLKRAAYIPSGRYMIQPQGESNYMWLTGFSNRKNYSCLWMPSNFSVFGDGENSVLALIATPVSPGTTDGRGDFSTTHMLVNKGSSTGLNKPISNENIHISMLKFDGNLVQQSGEGVSLCGTRNFSITHCTFTRSFYETMYIVYSRGGNISDCTHYSNGEFQWDGGGPLIDTCTHITMNNNVVTDCGYYALLAIDCWYSNFNNFMCQPDTYPAASGFQSLRVQGCYFSNVTGNKLYNSGYSAIWIHDGASNVISDNVCVYAGYGAGGGNQMSGIFVDSLTSNNRDRGEHIIKNNTCMMNKGSGLIVVGKKTEGISNDQNHIGHLIEGNMCSWNNRDGISIYGNYHRIVNNICKNNSLSQTTGILGDGYNGIGLNGSQYCLVSGNICTDLIEANPQAMNLDAWIGITENPQLFTPAHPAKYQNWGIVEYPHNPIAYEVSTISYISTGSGVMVPYTTNIVFTIPGGHTFGVGDILFFYGASNDNDDITGFAGYHYVTEVTAVTVTIVVQGLKVPGDPNPVYMVEYCTVSNNNMIINNNVMGNIGAFGIQAYALDIRVCGTNSVVSNNFGN